MTRTVLSQTNGTECKKSASLTGKQRTEQPQNRNLLFGIRSEVSRHGFSFVVFCCCFFFRTRAEKGIKLVQEGQYAQAVALFTEAIRCDPEDYRYNNWKGDSLHVRWEQILKPFCVSL